MADALIFDHVRTPRGRGKKDGALYEVPAVRLAAQPLEALRNRNDLDTKLVDDVVLGCVDPIGEAGGDIARAAVFAAGYDAGVPGVQINRFCASGLDAVNFAASSLPLVAGRFGTGEYKRVLISLLEEQWDAPFLRSSEATLRQRLELHPSGQFVAFDGNGTLLAAMYTQHVASLEVMQHGSKHVRAHSAGYAATHHN